MSAPWTCIDWQLPLQFPYLLRAWHLFAALQCCCAWLQRILRYPPYILQEVSRMQQSTPLPAPPAAARPPLIGPRALELAPPRILPGHSLPTLCPVLLLLHLWLHSPLCTPLPWGLLWGQRPKTPCRNRLMHLCLQVAETSQQPSRGSLLLAPPDPSAPLPNTAPEEHHRRVMTGHQALALCLCHSHWGQTSWGTRGPHPVLAASPL